MKPNSASQRLAHKAWRSLHADAGTARSLVNRAFERATRDGDELGAAWARLVCGFHRLYFATPQDAEQQLGAARSEFARLKARPLELLAATGEARALWRQGQVQRALDQLLPLRDEGLRLLRHEQRGLLLNALAGCHSGLGSSEQAFAYMYEALRNAGPKQGFGFDAALYCNLSHELLELGDHDEAIRQVERGLQRMQGLSNGRLLSVLMVNRVICLTELGRAAECLADVEALGKAQGDPTGRELVPMHFEDLALAAVQAGALPLARALVERAQALLPDERLGFALAKAALFKVQGKPVQALAQLDAVLPQCDAEGDAKPGLRMRCNLALARAELLEVCGEPTAALQALRDWRSLQAERARRASQARYQAAQLQTELLQLQHRVEEEDSKRQAAERARAQLAEAHAALQRKMEEVQALQAQLHIQATQDTLTGLANRRHLNETLPSVLALALREGTPLAVALIDLDRFKQVNDTHGHPAGDQVLAAFGLLLRQHLRKSDLAFRYGGEEFCLLMPNTPAMDAQQKLKALLTDWRAMAFALDSGAVLRLQTFSAGVTDSLSSLASPAGLLQAADARLLQAKQPRGCVVL